MCIALDIFPVLASLYKPISTFAFWLGRHNLSEMLFSLTVQLLGPCILLEGLPETERYRSDALVDVKMEEASVKDEDEDEVDPLDAFMAGNDAVGLGFMA